MQKRDRVPPTTTAISAKLERQIKSTSFFKRGKSALAGVAQWIECRPANEKRKIKLSLIPEDVTTQELMVFNTNKKKVL